MFRRALLKNNASRYVKYFEKAVCILFLFFIEPVAKSEWNKIKENFRKCNQRRERMFKGGAGNKKLPEFIVWKMTRKPEIFH